MPERQPHSLLVIGIKNTLNILKTIKTSKQASTFYLFNTSFFNWTAKLLEIVMELSIFFLPLALFQIDFNFVLSF